MIIEKQMSLGYILGEVMKNQKHLAGTEDDHDQESHAGESVNGNQEANRVFHATYGDVLDKILKNGILPGGGEKGKRNDPKSFFTGDRANAVFISKSKDFAIRYSEDIAVKRKAKFAVVFEIDIPKEVQLKPDKFFSKRDEAFYLQGEIPTKYIKGYEILQEVMVGKWPQMQVVSRHTVRQKTATISGTYYVPVIFGGEDS